jgi:hypothetical protein
MKLTVVNSKYKFRNSKVNLWHLTYNTLQLTFILPVKFVIESFKSFKYLGSILTNGEDVFVKLNLGLPLQKLHSTRRGIFLLAHWMIWAADRKNLESFEMWCLRRMEKISCTDHMRNEEVLLRVKEQNTVLHEISKRKANCFGHVLPRNCLLQRAIEEKINGGIEVTSRRERSRKKLRDELKEMKEYSYLKEEDLDRSVWRARFGRSSALAVRILNE